MTDARSGSADGRRPQPSAASGSSERGAERGRHGTRNTLLWGLGAMLGFAALGHLLSGSVVDFAAWVEAQGPAAGLWFVAGYSLAVLAWIPGMVMTLSAGAIFEPVEGVLWVFLGSTLGSAMAFVLARHVARDAVERRFGGSALFEAMDRAVGEQGFRIVLLLRLSPLFPFTPINFLLGLTRVRLRDYLLASFGMIPGTVMYVYYGRVIGDLAALREGAGPERDLTYWILLGVGLVATIAVTILLTRIAQRAVQSRLAEARNAQDVETSDG
ncbi:MAG: TVP38/TMEM64 family protein [Deltaproteobacteria bacterium]|nr:TVP38/TMEM64 family protein [Deltaproteobacteria bacterium]